MNERLDYSSAGLVRDRQPRIPTITTVDALTSVAQTIVRVCFGNSPTSEQIEAVVRDVVPLVKATEGERLEATLEIIRRMVRR